MTKPFTGLIAYPITPLTHDGDPDLGAFAHLVQSAAAAGVSGVAVLATSGAGVTFDRAERRAVAETAVEATETAGSGDFAAVPVYAAISAASTREVVLLAKDAERSGVDGLLLAPFGYLPLLYAEVRGLFESVSDAVGLPLCFYNKPAQTQFDVGPDTLAALAVSANVRGVKETMRRENVDARVGTLREAVGDDFSIGLSADVQLLADLPAVDAWHTGLAALMPEEYVDIWRTARSRSLNADTLARLRAVAQTLAGIPRSIGALHAVAQELGIATAGPRGPFAAATQEDAALLHKALL